MTTISPKCTHTLLSLAIATSMSLISIQALASGFELNESSANGLGRAYAGDGVLADNASSQWVNPALLTDLTGTQVSAGMVYAKPDVKVKGMLSKALMRQKVMAANSNGNIAQDAYIPNLSVSHQFNDQLFMGFALGSNFGVTTDLGDDFAAAHFGHYAKIKTVEANLNFAYKVNPTLSLGAGLRYLKGDAALNAKGPKEGLAPSLPLANIKGDGTGWGWQLGAVSQLTPTTRLGISYKSEIMLKLKGDADGLLFGGLLHPKQRYSGKMDLALPAMADVSLSQQLGDRFTLVGSANWTQWSRFKQLVVNLDALGAKTVKQENWHDSYRLALGGVYKVTDLLSLRTGVAWDKSAVNNEHRTLTMPETDRTWLTFGAGYQVTPQLSLDAGLAYIMGKKSSINEPTNPLDKQPAQLYGAFSGYSKATAWLAGVQVSYQF